MNLPRIHSPTPSGHANARFYFDRDAECILRFFRRKLNHDPETDEEVIRVRPLFPDPQEIKNAKNLDDSLRASGFKDKYQHVIESAIVMDDQNKEEEEQQQQQGMTTTGSSSDDDEDEEEGEEGENEEEEDDEE